jgi:hypothetical protein
MDNSPLLQQAAQVYTAMIFEKFRKEYDLFSAACIKHRNEGETLSEYIVGMVNSDAVFKVRFNSFDSTVSCRYKLFETFDILCFHALMIFDRNDIKSVPSKYIRKRWIEDAKNGFVQGTRGRIIQEDAKRDSTQRYGKICPRLEKLADKASNCKEAWGMKL